MAHRGQPSETTEGSTRVGLASRFAFLKDGERHRPPPDNSVRGETRLQSRGPVHDPLFHRADRQGQRDVLLGGEGVDVHATTLGLFEDLHLHVWV